MRLRRLGLLILAVGCGKDQSAQEPGGPGQFGIDGGFGSPDGGKLPECAEETKDVFLISEEKGFYRFHPPTLTFKLIGTLNCGTPGDTPTSMAVDRTGIAWVRYSDAAIWKVSTRDLSCQSTSFVAPNSVSPFYKFGMGFSTSSKGGSNEELFLSDSQTGSGLGKLNRDTLKIGYVGAFSGVLSGKAAELTGTGEGKLYGFFITTPTQVAEISKGTGEIVSTRELANTSAGDAWAFSFYGGDFYIYTNAPNTGPPQAGGGSDVTRYRPKDGTVEVVKPKVGFKIVGAGVSTCAPTEGVK